MPYLVDTEVLVDVSRNTLGLSAMTALELISGAKTQREVDLIDRLIEAYETIPVDEAIGRRAYELLKLYAKSHGLRTFDSLIAATAIEKQRTLVTKNRKLFGMVNGLAVAILQYPWFPRAANARQPAAA
jgi:predicted nucleic acid-binding protein